MNYLCLLLPLFGIFASKFLGHSPLCPCDLECKPTQKLSKIKSKLIYRTHHKEKNWKNPFGCL